MNGRYNTKSPAVKRLMREAQELSEPTDQYFAQPLDDNLFEWHFTVRGPADSDFQNGIYHGRIILPVDYPMKPPSIIWLTPNGRFETHKKICLSISGHHPESWQPSWSIRTALLAIIGFMPTHPGGAIGSLDYTPEERKMMAKKSKDWKCPTCGEVTGILLDSSANSEATSNEAKELAAQINLQGEKPKCKEGTCPIEQARLSEIQSQSADAAPESQQTSTSSDSVVQTNDSSSTFNNNTSVSYQDVQNGPQELSSPSIPLPPMSFPQFPPWSPFPMPPAGFPFQYPNMAFPNLPPIMPMQFPYPPSHYAANPQSCWPMPPSGMFPGSFPPPPPFSSPPLSTNNSSAHDNTGNVSMNKNSQPSNQYSRSPSTCPVFTNRPSPVETSNETSSWSVSEASQNYAGDVFKELLTKVKRVGSDAKCEQTSAESSGGNTASSSATQEAAVSFKPTMSQEAKVQHENEKETMLSSKHAEGGTDSKMSKSLKKPEDRSVSERGDTNTEDNSESDVPAMDADQCPGLEKSACSSTPDLEKWKQKHQTNKGLRQRQSATASVPTDTMEEAAAEPDDGVVRQRIEAASGDTGLRHRPRMGPQVRPVNLNQQGAANRHTPERPFDLTFYLMVGLFTTSMVILINRLAMINWSEF